MITHRCDNCNKIINKDEQVMIGREVWQKIELCAACAEPILSGVAQAKLPPDLKAKIKM